MEFEKVPVGFGFALAGNTAAMNRFAHLTEAQRQEILEKAQNARTEREIYELMAGLAIGPLK